MRITADEDKYTGLVWEPAEYRVTVEGKATAAAAERKGTQSFILTLTDPCNPPKSLTSPTIPDYEYTIVTEPVLYEAEDFVVDPPYCRLTYTSTVELLDNGKSAVTVQSDQKSYSIYYDEDLTPVDETQETQRITLDVVTSSLWSPAVPENLSEQESFELIFLDPCTNEDIV